MYSTYLTLAVIALSVLLIYLMVKRSDSIDKIENLQRENQQLKELKENIENKSIESIKAIEELKNKEIEQIQYRLSKMDDISARIASEEIKDFVRAINWKKELKIIDLLGRKNKKSNKYAEIALENEASKYAEAIEAQYKLMLICNLYPELEALIESNDAKDYEGLEIPDPKIRMTEVEELLRKIDAAGGSRRLFEFKEVEKFNSNITAIPYMAEILADYKTYDMEHKARELDWGYSVARQEKTASIREIRKEAKELVKENLEAKYQLSYLLELYPALQDVIETDYRDVPTEINTVAATEHDGVRDFLTKEEYENLSTTEKNQLALDRYIESKKKTKWQIGRDYELYIGYLYSKAGYEIDYYGSNMGLEDLGRDLIAKKGNNFLIVQCKYWSSQKLIHEKHITQLYGTMICFVLENGLEQSQVKGILVTNIKVSDKAREMANFLGIKIEENIPMEEYPRIKCNIGKDGKKIYHLPFDQQYDNAKIKDEGEFFAKTVDEAEKAGFRRAFRWHNME